MANSKDQKEFLDLLKEQSIYKQNLMLLQWDTHAKIPSQGLDQRLDAIGYMSEKLHQLNTSDKMKYFIDQFKEDQENKRFQQLAEECERIYERGSKIPSSLQKEFVMDKSKSEAVWQEAREKNDYQLFQPYLEKMVDYTKRFTDYWGYETNRYDALLQNYEPGMTTQKIDRVFPALRKSLVELLDRIQQSTQKIDEDIITKPFPVHNQKKLSLELLSKIGFDHQAGRLDTSVHPYTFAFHKRDVRITTRYNPNDFRPSVFSAMHEGGHALYEQNFADELVDTPLAEVSSMGMHESQALLWESWICGSKEFWEANLPLFKKYAPEHFQQLTVEDFYRSSHKVEPSFIRVDADEVTYPLHIMLRYEIEKLLLHDEIHVGDLPQIWNEKMQEYLGIKPKTDREGILQDIHWSSGDFGYFPSYTLGMMYAAQIFHTMHGELQVDELIRNNQLDQIKQWLIERIYQHGKQKKPLVMLEEITKEELQAKYLINYLTEKYEKIYRI